MSSIDRKDVEISLASTRDVATISEILVEAAQWMALHKKPLWSSLDLSAAFVEPLVHRNQFVIARLQNQIIGVMTLQWNDLEFWADKDDGEAGYLHKIAVRRAVCGCGIPALMVAWAVFRAKQHGAKYLRLDCDLQPSLCAIYERLGFIKLDTLRVSPAERSPFTVARYQKEVG